MTGTTCAASCGPGPYPDCEVPGTPMTPATHQTEE